MRKKSSQMFRTNDPKKSFSKNAILPFSQTPDYKNNKLKNEMLIKQNLRK